jgi:hypothetical protein
LPRNSPQRREDAAARNVGRQIPERRTQSLYADIIADFAAQGTESIQVAIEGMNPATLRAVLRRAVKGNEDVKMAQRGEHTCLARTPKQ